MYSARRMLVKEFKSDAEFTAKDAAGKPRIFCVEHESGRTITNLSWTEACAEARQLNEELVTMLVVA